MKRKEKHTPKKVIQRLLLAAAVLAALGIITVAGINFYVVGQSREYILTEEDCKAFGADCILVLGCGLIDAETPSDMLADRVSQGTALYLAGAAPKLLMSGDHGREEYDEVNVMKAYAVRGGAARDDVFMDHAGFSTYESMVRAKEVFGAKRVLIVTQQYHLFRAVYIARQLGLDAYGCPSDLRSYRSPVMREIREVAARNKDFFYCIFKPQPTYLGEKISLAGSGAVTDDENTGRFLGV